MTPAMTVTRLTPPGRGGVGVILFSGVGAFEVLTRFWTLSSGERFSSNVDISPLRNRPLFGWFHFDPAKESHEEIVVHLVSNEEIEIHCHGGDLIVAAIIRTLVGAGAAEVVDEKPTWNDDKTDNKIDAAKAVSCFESTDPRMADAASLPDFRSDALRLLPNARTERTAKIILDQAGGRPERFVAELLAAVSEGANDGTESLDSPRRHSERIARLDRILSLAELGRRLFEPPRVILTGPVNAGKSSLLNALVGFDRVIADPTEGTTRDAVIAETILDGFPVALCDTAGIRRGENGIEREGIDRAAALLKRADLILIVFDAAAAGANPPNDFFDRLSSFGIEFNPNNNPNKTTGDNHPLLSPVDGSVPSDSESPPRLVVLNKIDLPVTRRNPFWQRFEEETDKRDFIKTGVPNPETIAALQRRIVDALFPLIPEDGEIVPLNNRQKAFFRRIRIAVERRLLRD